MAVAVLAAMPAAAQRDRADRGLKAVLAAPAESSPLAADRAAAEAQQGVVLAVAPRMQPSRAEHRAAGAAEAMVAAAVARAERLEPEVPLQRVAAEPVAGPPLLPRLARRW